MTIARERARAIANVALLLLLAVLIVTSLLPGDSKPMQVIDSLPVSDKVLHLSAYTVVAAVAAFGRERKSRALLFGVGLFLLGIALELFQAFVPGRTPDIFDQAANTAGVCLGILSGWTARNATHTQR